MSNFEAIQLVRQVKEVAKLRLDVIPFVSDSKFSRLGGKVYYAIDTNLMYLYLNPKEEASKFGRVFSFDNKQTVDLLGTAFSRYIFEVLATKDNPLFLLIGHDAECRYLYEQLVKEKDKQIDKLDAEKEELNRIFTVVSELPDGDAKVKYIQKHASFLVEFLFLDSSPTTQFERFTDLIGKKKIGRISSLIRSEKSGKNSPVYNALSSPTTAVDMVRESFFRLEWQKSLRRTGKKSEHSVKADSSALARLQLINEKLAPYKEKIALITGDRTLFEASANLNWSNEKESFADSYLRSPRAFISAPEVLNPGNSAIQSSLRGGDLMSLWLDTYLAKFVDGSGVSSSSLRLLINKIDELKHSYGIENTSKIRKIFERNWTLHTSNLRTTHSLQEMLPQREISNIVSKLSVEGIESTVEKLEKKFSEKNNESWRTFFDSLVTLNIEFLDSKTFAVPRAINPVPPLSLDVVDALQAFISCLNTSTEVFKSEEDLHYWIDVLDRADPTEYSRYVAFSAYFYRKNHTSVAILLSKRAIQIADSSETSIDYFKRKLLKSERITTGREAKYLLSVVLKWQARKTTDFDECYKHLRQVEEDIDNCNGALTQLSSCHSFETFKPYRYRTNHRVRVERLSIQTISILFDKYHRKDTADGHGELLRTVYSLSDALILEIRNCHLVNDHRLREEIFTYLFTELIYLDSIYRTITTRTVLAISDFCDTQGICNKYLDNVRDTYHWEQFNSKLIPWRVLIAITYYVGCYGDESLREKYRTDELLREVKLVASRDSRSVFNNRLEEEMFTSICNLLE